MRIIQLSLLLLLAIPFSQATPPDFEELVEKTYGVHATQIYPKDGLMIPGSLFSVRAQLVDLGSTGKDDDSSSQPSAPSQELLTLEERLQLAKVAPKYRFTLHWSLSGLAESHDFQTEQGETLSVVRNTHPFVILEPLASLLPESYGGHDQDWITIGPHKLSSGSILLAAQAYEKETLTFPGKVILFNPEKERAEDLVPQILRERDAYVLKRDIPASAYDTEEKAKRTGYTKDNIPLTVNEELHFPSPKAFYTSLREAGYAWESHTLTYFSKFETVLKGLFERAIIFQAQLLFPEKLEGAPIKGLHCNVDPIAYVMGSIKEFPAFMEKTKLSARTQEVFKLWLMELKIWVGHVCKKDNLTGLEFLPGISDKKAYLDRVVRTVDQHSTKPMFKLFEHEN